MYIGTNLRTLLDKILLHCQRWEYLHLVVPPNLLALLDTSLPILRGLTIGSSVNSDRLPHVLAPFDRAPNLRSVLFGDAFLVATVTLPWAQLTRFEGACVEPFECVSILVAAPQLVYCQFTVCEPSAVVQPELPTTVVHAALQHFILDADEVEDDDNLDLTDLLGRLTLPALKTLQISERSVSLDALMGFMSRSGCVVELLSITGSVLGQSVYCEAFPSIPAIILL
ncbi:hypothetical protein C8R46DRAFT_1125489 [Mycena filopes]|nr:hypothetical protein C8R46DRAFT_1125489 [Mycena filopes]